MATDPATHGQGRWARPLRPRDPDEAHRAATPLELFFDLCFVVAIALAASKLHHAIVEDHLWEGLVSYASVFFAIWWAWMGFTWLASGYDNGDPAWRLKVFVQMAGVLVIAAGVPAAFERHDFTVVTWGYVVLRTGLVGQFLRAAAGDPARRSSNLRQAGGIVACQLGWLGLLAVPGAWWAAGFALLVLAELLVPVWAQSAARIPWHRHHIAERYGLLTIIVLGESVLAATVAIQAALGEGWPEARLAGAIVGTLLLLFSLWWLYFDEPASEQLHSPRSAFAWGYGHYLVFASAAAVGAGIAAYTDVVTGHGHVDPRVAAGAVTVPAALFLLVVWGLHGWGRDRGAAYVAGSALAAAAVLAATFAPAPLVVAGLVLVAQVAVRVAYPAGA